MTSAAVLGVDGCRGGWLGALVRDGSVRWLVLPDARAVLAVDAAAHGIDIPIGLPERGRRTCDLAARARLGSARNSVFCTPIRAVLDAPDYDVARQRCREHGEPMLSIQTWHILPKIRDVDDALPSTPDRRVVEVHPEVSFRTLDVGVSGPKKSVAGAGQRIRALSGWLDVGAALAVVPPGPALDDALDALVAAWSAERWLAGAAVVLPVGPTPYDTRGRPMRIVA